MPAREPAGDPLARRVPLRFGGEPAGDPLARRVPLRFGALGLPLAALGLGRARSWVEVAPDVVRVRMGWAFAGDVPRSAVRAVRPARARLSIGVHGWRGRWLVNGATRPLVAIAIDPPARARVVVLPVRLRELTLSVDDPDSFARLLPAQGPAPPASPSAIG